MRRESHHGCEEALVEALGALILEDLAETVRYAVVVLAFTVSVDWLVVEARRDDVEGLDDEGDGRASDGARHDLRPLTLGRENL